MKFCPRLVLCGVLITCLVCFLYLLHLYHTPAKQEPLLPYISDNFGSDCHYQGRLLKEGAVFSEMCRDCYCSFGIVECAVAHCKSAKNSLGMDLIVRDVQVIIPTSRRDFPGTVAVMNSVLKHTLHRVKFTIVLYHRNTGPTSQNEDTNHLHKWIRGTQLRYSNYVIVVAKKHWFKSDSSIFHLFDEMNMGNGVNSTRDIKAEFYGLIDTPSSAMLMLNTILPLEHKVILLGNSIIIKGDIADLFNIDLKGQPIAVLNNCKEVTPSHPLYFDTYFRTRHIPDVLQIPQTACAFSQNILVVDLDNWYTSQTERQLSLLLYKIMISRLDLLSQDSDTLCFVPLLLKFWNSARDINAVWNVRNMLPGNVTERTERNVKILNWELEKPWISQPSEWTRYFVSDPTGILRLGDPA